MGALYFSSRGRRTVRRPARAAGQCGDETGDGRVAVTVLCGDIRMVIYWRGGLRRALAHSLKGDPPSDEAPNLARFLSSIRVLSAMALQRGKLALPSLKGLHGTSNSLIAGARGFKGHD
jgi:hypothetical protein